MNNENKILNHNYGYGLNITPSKINKLFLGNIAELKTYVKDIIYTNLIENKNLKLQDITNMVRLFR